MNMIITTECIKCKHGSICKYNDQKVHCSEKNKDYFLGQRIPCENKKQKGGENNDK